MEATLIGTMLKLGAPWILAAVLLWLLIAERKRSDALVKKLQELGTDIVKTSEQMNGWLARIEDKISRR